MAEIADNLSLVNTDLPINLLRQAAAVVKLSSEKGMSALETAKFNMREMEQGYGGRWICVVGRDFSAQLTPIKHRFALFKTPRFAVLLLQLPTTRPGGDGAVPTENGLLDLKVANGESNLVTVPPTPVGVSDSSENSAEEEEEDDDEEEEEEESDSEEDEVSDSQDSSEEEEEEEDTTTEE